MDLGPLSQLTKSTNVFLHLQQGICYGWPPPSDDGQSARSSSISAAAKLISPSTFTSGSESPGGVVVTFSFDNGEVWGPHQALHLHCQIHHSWGPRRVQHHQCLEEDAWCQRNGERGEDGRSAAWSITVATYQNICKTSDNFKQIWFTSVTLHLSFRDSHVFDMFLVVSGFPESWKPRFVTKSV